MPAVVIYDTRFIGAVSFMRLGDFLVLQKLQDITEFRAELRSKRSGCDLTFALPTMLSRQCTRDELHISQIDRNPYNFITLLIVVNMIVEI